VTGVAFPRVLDPVDDLPPTTVITSVTSAGDRLVVRGVTGENGTVKRVLVNGIAATASRENVAEWEAVIPASVKVTAHAEDAAGNVERRPHGVASK
jgi:hypothetical protein